MEQKKDVVELFDSEVDQFNYLYRERCVSCVIPELERREIPIFTMPMPQRRSLHCLAEVYPGQWVSVKDLAKAIQADKSEVSRALYPLEEKGYVQTRVDSSDRRIKLATVTQSGIDVRKSGNTEGLTLLRDYMEHFLSEEEIWEMYEHLAAVNALWQKLKPEEYFAEE